MESGEARMPKPPITGKAEGERPEIPHLEASDSLPEKIELVQ
jgi:hypothetical protein